MRRSTHSRAARGSPCRKGRNLRPENYGRDRVSCRFDLAHPSRQHYLFLASHHACRLKRPNLWPSDNPRWYWDSWTLSRCSAPRTGGNRDKRYCNPAFWNRCEWLIRQAHKLRLNCNKGAGMLYICSFSRCCPHYLPRGYCDHSAETGQCMRDQSDGPYFSLPDADCDRPHMDWMHL